MEIAAARPPPINPNYAGSYILLGDAKIIIDDYESAAFNFKKAITLNSKSKSASVAYAHLCWLKYKSRNMNDAVKNCNKALEINPKNSFALDTRGAIKHYIGDRDGACIDYKNACTNGYKKREKYLASEAGEWCKN